MWARVGRIFQENNTTIAELFDCVSISRWLFLKVHPWSTTREICEHTGKNPAYAIRLMTPQNVVVSEFILARKRILIGHNYTRKTT